MPIFSQAIFEPNSAIIAALTHIFLLFIGKRYLGAMKTIHVLVTVNLTHISLLFLRDNGVAQRGSKLLHTGI